MLRCSSRATPLLIPLATHDDRPRYRQIYDALRTAILSGALGAGARLPASRVLADDLGVSRTTVLGAYDELAAEGLVTARAGAGTVVAAPPRRIDAGIARASVSPRDGAYTSAPSTRAARLAETAGDALAASTRSFALGVPALDAFPVTTWARLTARRWREAPRELLRPDDGLGFEPLRRAIAAHVLLSRGLRCVPGQVVVTAGALQAIDLVARLALEPDATVWFEEPGYGPARAAFVAAGARVVGVPVDDEGIDVAEGRRLAPHARLAFVTPAHQMPSGVTLSPRRRAALLDWAARVDAWIVEDDYAGLFRYDGHPVPALRAFDHPGAERVVHVGSFTDTLFPALRIGYAVLPRALVDAFVVARRASDRQSPTAEQAVLADFIARGHFTRHLRRMRTLYAARQRALVRIAERDVASLLRVLPSPAGLHVLAVLRPGVDVGRVAAEARTCGVVALPVRDARHAHPHGAAALALGYAPFSPSAMRDGLTRLAAAVRRVSAA